MAFICQKGQLAKQRLFLFPSSGENFLELVKCQNWENSPAIFSNEPRPCEISPKITLCGFIGRHFHNIHLLYRNTLSDKIFQSGYDALLERTVSSLYIQSDADRQESCISKAWKHSGIEQRCLPYAAFSIQGDENIIHHHPCQIIDIIFPSAEFERIVSIFRILVG